MSVNGKNAGQNNFQIDGVAINNIANSGSANDSGIYGGIGIPNPDSLQEFRIQTSTYDASYRCNPGANINTPSPVLTLGVAGELQEGWSLSGVTTIQNGDALTLIDSRDGTAFNVSGTTIQNRYSRP